MPLTKEEVELLGYIGIGVLILLGTGIYLFLTRHYPAHPHTTPKGNTVSMSRDLWGKWWINTYDGPYFSLKEAEEYANTHM